MQLTARLRQLAEELPVPIRRLAYRGAYTVLRGYWRLTGPSTTGAKCVLTQGEQVLLVRHTYGPRTWELPGGSIDPGESPAAAARREMNEELGLVIHDLAPLGDMVINADHRHDHVHVFGAELDAPRLTVERGELAEVRWFPRDDLPAELGRYARVIIASLPPAG